MGLRIWQKDLVVGVLDKGSERKGKKLLCNGEDRNEAVCSQLDLHALQTDPWGRAMADSSN